MHTTRPDSVYVSRRLKRALGYVYRQEMKDGDCSIDGLVNRILENWIEATHSKVLNHLDAMERADEVFRKSYEPNTEKPEADA